MFTPEVLNTFMALLAISEPSGTLQDCDAWKCAKTKSTKLPAVAVETKADEGESTLIKLNMTAWPMPNYASRKLNQTQDKDLTEFQAAAVTHIRMITLDRLRKLMGWSIRADICGQCNDHDVRFACAFHRIYLCQPCKHMECKRNLFRVGDKTTKVLPKILHTQATSRRLRYFSY